MYSDIPPKDQVSFRPSNYILVKVRSILFSIDYPIQTFVIIFNLEVEDDIVKGRAILYGCWRPDLSC